jgi:prophage regulatory protein
LLLVSEVMELAGIGRSGLYRRMTAGTFPRPVRLGVQRVAWRRSDVEAWIAAQPASGMGGGLIINRG